MSDCPFHDLPPGDTVLIQGGHFTYPMSAQLACETWHDTEGIRRWIGELADRTLVKQYEQNQ